MLYSRIGIVAVLLGAEVFVGGAIIWAATGGSPGSAQAANINRMSEQVSLDAGNAPHVVINDPDTRVVITASSDNRVHVTDHTHLVGFFLGQHYDAKLNVDRTADGVSIRRGDGLPHNALGFFGVDFQQTEVAVPSNSALELQHCGGATLDGVQASDVKIACGDGSLHFDDVQSPSIEAATNDGSIHASNLRIGGGSLHSDDGSIRIALTDPNLTVHAQTGDGSIRINGRRVAQDGDTAGSTYQFGTGGGSLQVSSQDGSIHISSNGAR